MSRLFVFGLGYTAKAIAAVLEGWTIEATGADGTLAFDNEAAVREALARATHVLSSVPPGDEGDPVLMRYGDALGHRWPTGPSRPRPNEGKSAGKEL